MPTVKDNQFIERIYNGKELIRRVYKGRDLVYGLYDIIYHNLNNIYKPINDINRYAWGKNRYIAPTSGNDFDDYFDQYRTHWFGWFDDRDLSIERQKINNRYAITKDEKKDLDLYAKWRQKKFSYNYKYTEYTPGGGATAADLPPKINGEWPYWNQLPEEWYTRSGGWYNYSNAYHGECTWGTTGRTGQLYRGATAAPYGVVGGPSPMAASWGRVVDDQERWGGGWVPTEDYSLVKIGDVIVYNNTTGSDAPWPGHVVTVEEVLGDGKFKVSTWNANGGDHKFHGTYTETHTPLTGGSDYSSRLSIARYLIYTGSGGTSTTEIEEDCEDQNNPSIPNYEHTTPPQEEGELAPLPPGGRGTLWSALPESWYTRSGGWYNYSARYPGQCAWGANGRTGQVRNNPDARAPKGGGSYGNAEDWFTNYGGNWSPTTDWTQAWVGDCIIYDYPPGKPDSHGHVVVIEEVLGNGSFKVSSWNYRENGKSSLKYGGTYTEKNLPGEKGAAGSGYRPILGYLINHIDPVIGGGGGSAAYESVHYITSERQFDYNNQVWSDWEIVDTSTENWYFDWSNSDGGGGE